MSEEDITASREQAEAIRLAILLPAAAGAARKPAVPRELTAVGAKNMIGVILSSLKTSPLTSRP
jgi:hypothetical protein